MLFWGLTQFLTLMLFWGLTVPDPDVGGADTVSDPDVGGADSF